MSVAEATFNAKGVRVSLDGNVVLHDISLRIDGGEFVILLGGNGSGKTTLVRSLLGLVQPDEGRIELFGVPVADFDRWARIGYVPQRLALPAAVPATVGEVVLSGRIAHAGLWRPYSREDRAAAERAIDEADLRELKDARVSHLSGGQQQRVLIARALASEPDVIVLDEPVSHVDVEHQIAFARLLAGSHAAGKTVLMVAHALGAMSGLATRVVVLDDGRLVYDGPPEGAHLHDEDIHHHEPAKGGGLRPIGEER